MKHIYTFIFFCFTITSIAQASISENVISNAGNTNSNTSNILNFTIGETFITSITNTASIDQGFWAGSGSLNTLSNENIVLEDSFITLYPNPVTSFFKIKTTSFNNYSISLFNSNGQQLFTKKITAASLENQIDISALAQGIYMVSISNDHQHKKFKIIKQ